MSGFYLTLRVRYYAEFKKKFGKNVDQYIIKEREYIKKFLKENYKKELNFNDNIDLKVTKGLAKTQEQSIIFSKYYQKDNIPNDEELLNDLNDFLDAYEFLLDNYISLMDWINVFEEDILDPKIELYLCQLSQFSCLFCPRRQCKVQQLNGNAGATADN